MRRVAAIVTIGLAGAGPAVALAVGTGTGRIEPVTGRIVDLRAVVRDQLTRVEVTETRTGRTIAVPSDVLFRFDSAAVSPAGREALRAVAGDVSPGPVTVVGHTDARGPAAYNAALSRRRAAEVAQVLRGLLARPAIPIVVRGAGESDPAASNASEAGRRRNRRVEIRLPGGRG